MNPPRTQQALLRLARPIAACYGRDFFFGPFLSAAIAGRDEAAMRLAITTALTEGVKPRTLDEIILQSHLFLGFPAMIEASRLFAEVQPTRRVSRRLPKPYSVSRVRGWNRDGKAKIRSIYGTAFGRLVEYINSFSPQVLTWMINDGYGQVLSRPGASFPLRELSIVATLTVTGYENQLKAHIRGALNVGVDPDLIIQTIANCRCFCGQENLTKASGILTQAMGA